MKKIIYLSLFLLSIILVPSLVSADLGPPAGFHNADLCSKIVNQNEYPDIVLIAYSSGPMTDKSVGTLIDNDNCLVGGYKFNSLSVYWTTKEKFKSIDLKNLKLKTVKVKGGGYDINGNPAYYDSYIPADLNLLAGPIPFYGGFVADSTHISKTTVEYLIEKLPNGNLTLLKSKQIISYNNGSRDKVEIFNDVVKKDEPSNKKVSNDSKPSLDDKPLEQKNAPIKRGFWQNIMCLFGIKKNC